VLALFSKANFGARPALPTYLPLSYPASHTPTHIDVGEVVDELDQEGDHSVQAVRAHLLQYIDRDNNTATR
jgi:hypothetical protein